ncbi:hypothetical protein GE061_010903 [Apolygus lucorum]|uniref:Uncharacterized protein n=1 Tax=Apolygus lucorum TaxID=248454 RepID=A0A6A4K7N4_APOLU|nr:hypothetical protein GE061_010903 [Apolygus lucorum]
MNKKVGNISLNTVNTTGYKLRSRASLPYSESQIQKLSLEFRKIQKECNLSKKKCAFDFVRDEQEKEKESLSEKIALEDDELKSKNEEVIDLLLTNGKIDLDKVICLHVFSIQQSNQCKQSGKKQDEPQVHKTKINPLTRYYNYLPCYLIEDQDTIINCKCWKRENAVFSNSQRAINVHLQVNCQVESMIHTVTNVLENLNPAKLKLLSSRAHSVEEVGNVLKKPENLTFISSLLHSKFIKKNKVTRTEMCSLITGRTDLIQDTSKFKKNIVFRLDIPGSLANIYRDIAIQEGKRPTAAPTVKNQSEYSFEQLLQMKKNLGSDISLIPGYQLLQKGSSSAGIAVINQNGTNISYIASGSAKQNKSKSDLTIYMQSPKVSDHQYVMDKMSEMEGDKIILAKPNNRIEEACLKMAKRHMKTEKKVLQDDVNHSEIKEDIIKRLTNEERLAIAEKAAKLKSTSTNAKGEIPSVPIVDLLRGSVERDSLLKLLREATDKEKEVMFKPANQGGMGIGELLMDKSDVSMISRPERISDTNNIAVVEKEHFSIAPKKLNIGVHSLFGTLKIEQKVAKKEIEKSCGAFISRLKHKEGRLKEKK